jgi:arylsulfatase A-like enzyme
VDRRPDSAARRILDVLREGGLDGDTWVVYSTDHGEMLGTHGLPNKMVFYEQSVRVPQFGRCRQLQQRVRRCTPNYRNCSTP